MTTNENTTAQNVTLGMSVLYVDSRGRQKVAVVTGTPESVQEGTNLPVPAEGQANLIVFGGKSVYFRYQVPSAALVEQIKAQGNDDFEGGGYFTAL